MPQADIAPTIMMICMFGVIAVAIMARHQHRMALLLHGKPQVNDQLEQRVFALESEVHRLRQALNDSIIANDQSPLSKPTTVIDTPPPMPRQQT